MKHPPSKKRVYIVFFMSVGLSVDQTVSADYLKYHSPQSLHISPVQVDYSYRILGHMVKGQGHSDLECYPLIILNTIYYYNMIFGNGLGMTSNDVWVTRSNLKVMVTLNVKMVSADCLEYYISQRLHISHVGLS